MPEGSVRDQLRSLAAQEGAAFQWVPLFEKAPPPVAIDADRVRGMLLGVAIGDALGNTTESRLPRSRHAAHGEIRDYLPNRHADGRAAGLPSDDTQMTFWTVEHLIEQRRLDPSSLAEHFATRTIFGMGASVAQFRRSWDIGRPWWSAAPRSAGNGTLMRIAPVVLPHLRSPTADLWSDAAANCLITHHDRAAVSSAVAFVGILWELLGCQAPPAPAWWLDRYVALAAPVEGEAVYEPRNYALPPWRGSLATFVEGPVRQAVDAGVTVLEGGERWHSGAYLLETVPSVLHILARHGHDPEEAVVRAVNDTKDNDTIAAIVGACVGALHGAGTFPRRWREDLSGRLGIDDDGTVQALIDEALETFC